MAASEVFERDDDLKTVEIRIATSICRCLPSLFGVVSGHAEDILHADEPEQKCVIRCRVSLRSVFYSNPVQEIKLDSDSKEKQIIHSDFGRQVLSCEALKSA